MILIGFLDIRNTNSVKTAQAMSDSIKKVIGRQVFAYFVQMVLVLFQITGREGLTVCRINQRRIQFNHLLPGMPVIVQVLNPDDGALDAGKLFMAASPQNRMPFLSIEIWSAVCPGVSMTSNGNDSALKAGESMVISLSI